MAVVVNEFGFLAGSIGRAAADRIIAAVRRATAEGLPLLASTASGGTRMQEGTPAFVRMAEISRALMEHRAAGLPYLVHLRHPTTGGVYASWGSLGHVTVAEPGALVGFLGPKVYEALNGRPFRPGVQVAENLAAVGVIDGVVAAEDLPGDGRPRPGGARRPARARAGCPPAPHRPLAGLSAWDSIERTRRTDRIGLRDLLAHGASGTVRLRGTDEGERDSTVMVALTRIDDQPCVVVGQDRARQAPGHAMGPGALREARRGMRLAEELGLPLVTVIDTPGAELSPDAEERAIAGEIARCIATLTTMTVPTVVGDPRPGLRGRGAGVPARPDRASRPSTPGCRRCRPRGRASSCTATSTTRPRWPSGSGCAPATCSRTGSCTTWCRRSTASRPATSPSRWPRRCRRCCASRSAGRGGRRLSAPRGSGV